MNPILELKPSMFLSQPWDSVLRSSEAETVARNTMVIRKRLGDKWDLTWEEYKAAREKEHGQGCCDREEGFFRDVIDIVDGPIGAISFSTAWAAEAKKACAA